MSFHPLLFVNIALLVAQYTLCRHGTLGPKYSYWISNMLYSALRLSARKIPLSFIWKLEEDELVIPCLLSSLTALIVALLGVVQCQAFCIYSYCFSCDATSGAVSWSMGHCRNRCEVVAFLALSA